VVIIQDGDVPDASKAQNFCRSYSNAAAWNAVVDASMMFGSGPESKYPKFIAVSPFPDPL